MQKILVFLSTLVSLASNQNASDLDCTLSFSAVYGNNDIKNALFEVDQFKKLEYIYQNHRHYYYSTITPSDLSHVGLNLGRRSRIVFTFELNSQNIDSDVKNHSCHIFTDNI